MEVKNIHVEQLAPVLQELGDVQHPMLAYRVAMLQQKVIPIVEALQKARTPSAEHQAYTKKRIALCEVHAQKDELGKPIQKKVPAQNSQGWTSNYEIADTELFTKNVEVLMREHAEVLEAEAVRQKEVVELLMAPAELEFTHKIKYSWCKDVLTGNALSLLIACDILEMDVDMDEEPVKTLSAVEDSEE